MTKYCRIIFRLYIFLFKNITLQESIFNDPVPNPDTQIYQFYNRWCKEMYLQFVILNFLYAICDFYQNNFCIEKRNIAVISLQPPSKLQKTHTEEEATIKL